MATYRQRGSANALCFGHQIGACDRQSDQPMARGQHQQMGSSYSRRLARLVAKQLHITGSWQLIFAPSLPTNCKPTSRSQTDRQLMQHRAKVASQVIHQQQRQRPPFGNRSEINSNTCQEQIEADARVSQAANGQPTSFECNKLSAASSHGPHSGHTCSGTKPSHRGAFGLLAPKLALLLLIFTNVTKSTCQLDGARASARVSSEPLHNRSSPLLSPTRSNGDGSELVPLVASLSSKANSSSGAKLVAMESQQGSVSRAGDKLAASGPMSQLPGVGGGQYHRLVPSGSAQVRLEKNRARPASTSNTMIQPPSKRPDRPADANTRATKPASDSKTDQVNGAYLADERWNIGAGQRSDGNTTKMTTITTTRPVHGLDELVDGDELAEGSDDMPEGDEADVGSRQADPLGLDAELELAILADDSDQQPSISANYNTNDNYQHSERQQRELQPANNTSSTDHGVAALDKSEIAAIESNNRFKRLIVRQLTNLIMNKPMDQVASRSSQGQAPMARLNGKGDHQSSATYLFENEESLAINRDRFIGMDNFDSDAVGGDVIDNYDQGSALIGHSPSMRAGGESKARANASAEAGLSLRAPLLASPAAAIKPDNLQTNPHPDDKLRLDHHFEDDQLNHLVVTATAADDASDDKQQATPEPNLVANWQEDQTVTCYPDYEDQSILEAAGGGNLTQEQQQQLLVGADSSGLLAVQAAASNSSNDLLIEQQQQQQLHQQQQQQQQNHKQGSSLAGQCVLSGSRMIAIITKVITPILFGIIVVVGLLGNIIVMLVILEDRKTERELTPTNLLILDLSLADLSFIIFCIPFTGWDYAVGHWIFGSLWCKINQYLIIVCAISSIYTLVLMSIDRFMAIVYPIECMSYRTSKNMLYAIYIKWLIILLIALPTWTMHGLVDSPLGPDQYNCRFLADLYNPLHFQLIFFVTSYLFPLILIFCLYLSLLNKLWFGTKPHGHKESLKMLESKKKVTWLVAGIVVVFALCWCPIQVMLILMRLRTHKITATYVAIQVFAHTLGYMNSCINPIVYAFASETFHQSFKRSWLGRLFACCGSGATGPAGTQFNGPMSQYRHNSLALGAGQQAGDRFLNPRHSTTAQQTTGCKLTVLNSGNDHLKGRNQSLNNIFSPQNNNSIQAGQQGKRSPSLGVEGGSSTSTLVTSTPYHKRDNDNERSNIISNYTQSRQLQPRDRPIIVDNKMKQQQQGRNRAQNSPTSLSCSKSDVAAIDELQHDNCSTNNDQDTRHNADQTSKQQLATSSGTNFRSHTPTGSIGGSGGGSRQMALIPRQPTATDSIFSPRTINNDLVIQNSSNNNNNNNHMKVPPKQQLVAQIVNQSNGNQISHRCEPGSEDSPS